MRMQEDDNKKRGREGKEVFATMSGEMEEGGGI